MCREMKVCSRHLSHMTKMAVMPIYGKNYFSWKTVDLFPQSLVCSIGDSRPIIVYPNDDPRLSLLAFYGKVKFCNLGYSLKEKVKTIDISETIAACECDLKVGKCRQLIEYSRSRSFTNQN